VDDGDGGVVVVAASVDVTAPPPPDTAITAGPSEGSFVATGNLVFGFVAAPSSGASYECTLDGGSFVPCSSPHDVTGLTDGSHVFGVRAVGAGGADATPATRSFVVDTTDPAVSVTTPVAGQAIPIGQVVTPAVACNDANLVSCTNSGVATNVAGPGTFTATGTDAAGNATTVVVPFTVVAVSNPGVRLRASTTTPARNAWVRLTATVEAPVPSGAWFVSIIDTSTELPVGLCGRQTTCTTYVRNGPGPHTYRAVVISLRLADPLQVLRTSPPVTVTWAR
jgi:hypothetical protein